MEKVPELNQELTEAERRDTIMRLEGLRAKVKMMLDIEREALEDLKHEIEWTSKPLDKICFSVFSPALVSASQMATLAPSAANLLAMALPIPLPPPVTIAT